MTHAQNSGSPKADSAAAAAPAKKRGFEQNVPEEGFDSAAPVEGSVCKRPRGSTFGCPSLPFCFAVFSRQAAARMMTSKVAPLVPRSLFAQWVLPCRGVRVVGATIAPAERMMALGGGNVGMLAVRLMGAGCAGASRHAKRMMLSIVARVAAVHSIATAEGAGLAMLLLEGRRGFAKDEKRAFALAAAGARLGCLHCQGILSNCYADGRVASKDVTKAFELGRESAAAGSCYGQVVVGWCYYNGAGVAEDKAEAARFYRLAADQGLAEAQVHLGSSFEDGEGVAENKAEALRLYQRRDMLQHSTAWVTCSILARALRGTPQKPCDYIVFQQNREMLMVCSAWPACTREAQAFLKITWKPCDSFASQQNRRKVLLHGYWLTAT